MKVKCINKRLECCGEVYDVVKIEDNINGEPKYFYVDRNYFQVIENKIELFNFFLESEVEIIEEDSE